MKNRAHIKSIPEEIIILEQCPAFKLLLRMFSKKVWKIVKPEDFLDDLFLLEDFDSFFRTEAIKNNLPIVVENELTPKINELIVDFKRRYWYIIRKPDDYYVKIRNKLYWSKKRTPDEEEAIKKDMRKFLAAYHIVKRVFEETHREWIKPWEEKPERYFNHLTWTMDIVLNELPNPNIDTVIISLLHDCIEDVEWMDYKTLKSIFWEYIAKWVESLSKKDLEEYYLSKFEIERLNQYEKNKRDDLKKELIKSAKEKRQDHYFWHLDELDDNILNVKFADRIHNLRTLDSLSQEKIVKKIRETEKYFLPVAKKRNPTAYKILKAEINDLMGRIEIR